MSLDPSRSCVSGACVKGRVNNNLEALNDDSRTPQSVLNLNHSARFANNLSRYVPIIVLIAFEYSDLTASAGSHNRAPKSADRLTVQNQKNLIMGNNDED